MCEQTAKVEGTMVVEKCAIKTLKESEEPQDILEIIEELPDESCGRYDDDNNNNSVTNVDDTSHTAASKEEARPSTTSANHHLDFSLSSIRFSLLGESVGKLRASLSHISVPSPRDLNIPSHSSHSNGSGGRFGGKKKGKKSSSVLPQSTVEFGRFEARALRLRYTQDDIFEIVDDPVQFQELKQGLRGLGAITDSLLKQKLHWYVKNSKRARLAEQEEAEQERLLRLQEEEERQLQLQLNNAEASAEEHPTTPPTEYKVIDDKVLQAGAVTASGILTPDDPSPKSVRGIFVPVA